MDSQTIAAQIEALASTDCVEQRSADLVDQWTSAGIGPEAVEPTLRFFESHPELDYGSPGALVHFVERFYRTGYEEKLLESVERRPTPHTIWMLNRLINGASSSDRRSALMLVLVRARSNPHTSTNMLTQIDGFLQYQLKDL